VRPPSVYGRDSLGLIAPAPDIPRAKVLGVSRNNGPETQTGVSRDVVGFPSAAVSPHISLWKDVTHVVDERGPSASRGNPSKLTFPNPDEMYPHLVEPVDSDSSRGTLSQGGRGPVGAAGRGKAKQDGGRAARARASGAQEAGTFPPCRYRSLPSGLYPIVFGFVCLFLPFPSRHPSRMVRRAYIRSIPSRTPVPCAFYREFEPSQCASPTPAPSNRHPQAQGTNREKTASEPHVAPLALCT